MRQHNALQYQEHVSGTELTKRLLELKGLIDGAGDRVQPGSVLLGNTEHSRSFLPLVRAGLAEKREFAAAYESPLGSIAFRLTDAGESILRGHYDAMTQMVAVPAAEEEAEQHEQTQLVDIVGAWAKGDVTSDQAMMAIRVYLSECEQRPANDFNRGYSAALRAAREQQAQQVVGIQKGNTDLAG